MKIKSDFEPVFVFIKKCPECVGVNNAGERAIDSEHSNTREICPHVTVTD